MYLKLYKYVDFRTSRYVTVLTFQDTNCSPQAQIKYKYANMAKDYLIKSRARVASRPT